MTFGIVETKVVSIVLLLVSTLAASLLPLLLAKKYAGALRTPKGQMVMSGALCFGAGILLSIVFLHLVPETTEVVEEAMAKGFIAETAYPIAMLMLMSGFFLIYLVEEIIHSQVHRAHHHLHHECSNDEQILPQHDSGSTSGESSASSKALAKGRQGGCGSVRGSGGHGSVKGAAILVASGKAEDAFRGDGCVEEEDPEAPPRQHTLPQKSEASAVSRNMSVVGSAVVVAALSIHSVFEGFAMGLEEHETDVWIMLAALVAHKLFIAFSVSWELLEEGVPRGAFFASSVVFSIASPLGASIAAALMHSGASSPETAAGLLVPCVLQALSGGTILYVSFCEVLERERQKPKGGLVRFVTLLLGFGLMAGLEAAGGHEHGHGGSDEGTESLAKTLAESFSPVHPLNVIS